METNKQPAIEKKIKKLDVLMKAGRIFLRWLYLVALLAIIAFSYFTWNKYVENADWSEQQKRDYINQQAVFSFDQNAFQKATDFFESRKDKLQSAERFSGKDIYFPEGF